MENTKWYEETPGVASSKRIFGGACLAAGIFMKIGLYVSAIFIPVVDPVTASAQADGLVLAGATLLGVTGLADVVAGWKKPGA